jgi:hypothetical protein
MRFVPIYLDVLHAAERGEAARAAARRAMYARPDADPLPEVVPVRAGSSLRDRLRPVLAAVRWVARRDRPQEPGAA